MKLIIVISIVLGLTSLKVTNAKDIKSKPNVIVIFTDDHRYDGIHALGNDQVKTPNLDALVNGGITFSNAYLQGANSGGTCVPSRAQLLTGRGIFDIPNGVGHFFPKEMISFPMAFKEAGYFTFITGKSHNVPEAAMRGFCGGEKLYGLANAYYKPHFRMAYQDFREDGKYGKEYLYFVGGENNDIKLNPEENLDYIGPHSSEIFAKAAVDFITEYDKIQPFLLYLAFHAPHDTRIAPPEYHAMYPPEKIKLPINFLQNHPFDSGDLYIRDEKLAPFPRTEENTKKQISDYYAIITHMDEQIGKVMKALQDNDLNQNTIIVFASDSGLGMGSHGLFGKQNLYDDAGIHVPLVFFGPGVPKNEKRDDLCYTFDIFPTICELAGIPIPESVTGRSLINSIKKKTGNSVRKELYFVYKNFQRALRDEKFKLIEYCVNGNRHTQFFNIINDPYELDNLAENPEFEKKVNKFRKRLKSYQLVESDWGNEFWETYLKQ